MKSNEERVKSILGKAKHYKRVRLKALSTVAFSICAVAVIATHVGFKQKDTNNVMQNDNLIVAVEDTVEEKYLPTFESKEELIKILKDKAKKSEYKFRFEAVTNTAADLAESAQASKEFSTDSVNAPSDDASAGGSYSETNTQVQGVDESDIVKTNGKSIYYLSNRDNILRVFDSQSEEIKLLHEIKFGDRIYNSQMYLDDNYIVVLTNAYIARESEEDTEAKKMAYYYGGRSCAKVFVYDINTYELVREIETEGNVVSSRKIGNDVYIVTNKYISMYDFNENEVLPIYKDTCESGEYVEVPATSIRYFEEFKDEEECNYMIITSFSLADMESKVNVNTYLGAGSEIYCSRESLYVARINYERQTGLRAIIADFVSTAEDNTTTSFHKFAIDNGDVKYVATGKVDGRLLNQFSMDEYDGYFRITTTDDVTGNNLFVLDKDLQLVGSVENLASGERIYATRFMGDKAYVVTYKTVDPLFVIDLSKPTEPKVLGELKIPGYSSYLHPLGENYLIGFGEDSVEKSYLNWEGKQQVTAYATGLKMAIFDVSDYCNPKELHSIKIGGRGSYSELLYNHKALLFNEEEGIIAFPASLTEEAGNYDNGVPMYGDTIFNGALVYNISVEDGISLRGKISHNNDTKYRNSIERIIYIGDKLYTVSENMMMASDIDTVEKIDELEFRNLGT